MNRYEKAQRLNTDDFKQLIGVAKETFDAMVNILEGGPTHRSINAGEGTQSCR